jgi:hypothetical protein
VQGGYSDKGEINLEFRKGIADNPKVNSILVVKGDKTNTHWTNWMNYKKTIYAIQEEKE